MFKLPKEKREAWLSEHRGEVIEKLNRDFSKPWFGWRRMGTFRSCGTWPMKSQSCVWFIWCMLRKSSVGWIYLFVTLLKTGCGELRNGLLVSTDLALLERVTLTSLGDFEWKDVSILMVMDPSNWYWGLVLTETAGQVCLLWAVGWWLKCGIVIIITRVFGGLVESRSRLHCWWQRNIIVREERESWRFKRQETERERDWTREENWYNCKITDLGTLQARSPAYIWYRIIGNIS